MFHQLSASTLIQAAIILVLDDCDLAGLFSKEQPK